MDLWRIKGGVMWMTFPGRETFCRRLRRRPDPLAPDAPLPPPDEHHDEDVQAVDGAADEGHQPEVPEGAVCALGVLYREAAQ